MSDGQIDAEQALQQIGGGQAAAATIYPTYLLAFQGDEEGPYIMETAPTMNAGQAVKVIVGAGNPFYAFDKNAIGFEWWNGVAVDDWSEAATCSALIADNNASIAAQIASPSSKVHAP
ncbi:hypothetical protein [Rhodopseudomonas parapalustris]